MDLLQTIHGQKNGQGDIFRDNNIPYGVSSMTVQTVLLHPFMRDMVYWVLNQQEAPGARQGIHTSPKPRGWGNPGGGVEVIDCVDERGIPYSFEKTIVLCGRRELTDETGFLNFTFERNLVSKLPFIRQDDPYGHSIIVLLARLHDFDSVSVKDTEEIICGSWFNLSVSPVELFRDGKDLPYWSHVRRTITVLRYLAERTGEYHVVHHIHPLWHLVFRIFTRDSRFPQQGYLIPYTGWYRIMRVFIERGIHDIDLDCIYEHLGPQIEEKRKQEDEDGFFEKEARGTSYVSFFSARRDRQSLVLQNAFNYHSQQERIIAQYEESYRRWAESIFAN